MTEKLHGLLDGTAQLQDSAFMRLLLGAIVYTAPAGGTACVEPGQSTPYERYRHELGTVRAVCLVCLVDRFWSVLSHLSWAPCRCRGHWVDFGSATGRDLTFPSTENGILAVLEFAGRGHPRILAAEASSSEVCGAAFGFDLLSRLLVYHALAVHLEVSVEVDVLNTFMNLSGTSRFYVGFRFDWYVSDSFTRPAQQRCCPVPCHLSKEVHMRRHHPACT